MSGIGFTTAWTTSEVSLKRSSFNDMVRHKKPDPPKLIMSANRMGSSTMKAWPAVGSGWKVDFGPTPPSDRPILSTLGSSFRYSCEMARSRSETAVTQMAAGEAGVSAEKDTFSMRSGSSGAGTRSGQAPKVVNRIQGWD
eukprot:TRINITY_DN96234_c0_g1_i1.p1 TRINITY_DN96234_c0_g1~~TRINITY_DN96234_c0_g1_i1.p1  ORF type:complete len:140 (+),score=31.41 TRINITY_DN96234_c0_g1_i1:36-455(+)